MSSVASILTQSQLHAARATLRHVAPQRASDDELSAVIEEHSSELALLQADLAAQDYASYDRATLLGGIAFHEHELAAATTQAERRLRARQVAARLGAPTSIDWEARFDAMRHADIVEALQTLGLDLDKGGREWWGRCPFHAGGQERTPSFAVNPEKAVWHCHGCHRGGDLVRFVMERQHLNAVEALSFLETIVDAPGVAA
jgi:hypothetical protein